MSTFKARGIVIKEDYSGEYDKNVVLLLKEFGKVKVYARSARKTSSKYLAGTQLLTYSDFVIFKKNNFLSITQIDIIESFANIRYDYDKLCVSNYVAELAEKLVLYEMQADNILLLLIKTLSALNKADADIKKIYFVFNFKLLQILGYAPVLDNCVNCGEKIDGEFFINTEGLICKNCSSLPCVNISKTAVFTINYILNSQISDIFKFNLENKNSEELLKLSDMLIKAHVEAEIKSMKSFDF